MTSSFPSPLATRLRRRAENHLRPRSTAPSAVVPGPSLRHSSAERPTPVVPVARPFGGCRSLHRGRSPLLAREPEAEWASGSVGGRPVDSSEWLEAAISTRIDQRVVIYDGAFGT